jgi:hypothetical protein
MRELDAIEVTVTELGPGQEQTRVVEQARPEAVLLSHFEVGELSPRTCLAQLTDLRVGLLSYLVVPVLLQLLEREQRHQRRRAQQQALRQLESLVGVLGLQRVLQFTKLDRRDTRSTSLDVLWRPGQPLVVTLKNPGAIVVDEVCIELVLYSLDGSLPVEN